jgi:hypothetical protein
MSDDRPVGVDLSQASVTELIAELKARNLTIGYFPPAKFQPPATIAGDLSVPADDYPDRVTPIHPFGKDEDEECEVTAKTDPSELAPLSLPPDGYLLPGLWIEQKIKELQDSFESVRRDSHASRGYSEAAVAAASSASIAANRAANQVIELNEILRHRPCMVESFEKPNWCPEVIAGGQDDGT